MKPKTKTKRGTQIMRLTTSAEFYHRIGHDHVRALVERIMVTHHSGNGVVLISADECHPLKSLRRETAPASSSGRQAVADSLLGNAVGGAG
jgi:hypothetical protein